jgi:DNA-binding winged helix-turn-helix (wHTH) protein
MPPTLRDEMVELLADIIHSLVSSKLEDMVGPMRGSSLRRDAELAIVESGSSGEPLVRLLAALNETVLRVGPLQLDLIDRAAKRGDRHIDLRPREFQLLKYMMRRSDKLLTRAALLKGVWHHKSARETNIVDVQMGLLRRKIDGASEAPMIRSVRGVGFVLNATPLSWDQYLSGRLTRRRDDQTSEKEDERNQQDSRGDSDRGFVGCFDCNDVF